MAAPITSDQRCEFTEMLAILLKAGLPLDHALETLAGVLEGAKLKGLSRSVLRCIREGMSLSAALAQAKAGFNPAYLGMVRVGETGGTLGHLLEQLAEILRRNQELKRKITSSLVYPAILLAFCLAAVLFILIYVLPAFVEVLRDTGKELPGIIAGMVWLGEFIRAYGWYLGLGFLVAALVVVAVAQAPGNRQALSGLVLRLGVLGRILSWWQTVLFCRNLGLMLDSGVPVYDACRFASATVSNLAYRAALASLEPELAEGSSLMAALAGVKVIPQVALRMVALGEQTGSVSSMLLRTSDLLESRINHLIGRILVLTEPVIILVMGLLVGTVVVSMLTTVFTLTQGTF